MEMLIGISILLVLLVFILDDVIRFMKNSKRRR